MTRLLAVDSSVVLTWVLQEPRWQVVDRLLDRDDLRVVLPDPGLTEVITIARRRGNASTPQEIALVLAARGVALETVTTADLVRAAELLEASEQHPGAPGRVSARPVTLSLGDALILAVVERLGCPVVSRDGYWKEFSASGHTSASVVSLG